MAQDNGRWQVVTCESKEKHVLQTYTDWANTISEEMLLGEDIVDETHSFNI